MADTGRGPEKDEAPTEDWRYAIYRTSDNLKNAKYPFNTYCAGTSGCQEASSTVEGFDESFVHWGMKIQKSAIACTEMGLGSSP